MKRRIRQFYVTYSGTKETYRRCHARAELFCLWNLLIFLSISLLSPSPSSLLLFNKKCIVEFLNISTSIIRTPLYGGPFYGPSPPPNLTSIMQTVVSLVCPFDSGKTSPCEKLYSTGTTVYQGEFYWFERIPTSTIRTSLYQLVPEMPIHTIPTFKQGQCSNAGTCLCPCGILGDKLRPNCFSPNREAP